MTCIHDFDEAQISVQVNASFSLWKKKAGQVVCKSATVKETYTQNKYKEMCYVQTTARLAQVVEHLL
jgi:hypothetical protein